MEKPKTSKPGPKPISHIPSPFRHIDGVENISTHRQFVRLRTYMEMKTSNRPPYYRLGASVPKSGATNSGRPNATYAVTLSGQVQVIRRFADPRATHRWIQNPKRPWNMAVEFADMEVK